MYLHQVSYINVKVSIHMLDSHISATRFKYTYQDSHGSTSTLINIHQVSNIDTKIRIFISRFAYLHQDSFLHDNIPMYTGRDALFKLKTAYK